MDVKFYQIFFSTTSEAAFRLYFIIDIWILTQKLKFFLKKPFQWQYNLIPKSMALQDVEDLD